MGPKAFGVVFNGIENQHHGTYKHALNYLYNKMIILYRAINWNPIIHG